MNIYQGIHMTFLSWINLYQKLEACLPTCYMMLVIVCKASFKNSIRILILMFHYHFRDLLFLKDVFLTSWHIIKFKFC